MLLNAVWGKYVLMLRAVAAMHFCARQFEGYQMTYRIKCNLEAANQHQRNISMSINALDVR